MIRTRPSTERGHFNFGWLDTRHTFSFGRYVDRNHMGFRSLRVINEDVVAPGQGFGEHPHENMEIISYVISGALAHRDSLGHVQTLRPGEVQRMSAGEGIEHAEFNPSASEPVHFLQIWILPAERNTQASYEQKTFSEDARRNRLALLASPDARDGSVRIGQDVRMYAGLIEAGHDVALSLKPGRHAWVQVVRGGVTLASTTEGKPVTLKVGDGAAISDEGSLHIAATDFDAEVLVFDLN